MTIFSIKIKMLINMLKLNSKHEPRVWVKDSHYCHIEPLKSTPEIMFLQGNSPPKASLNSMSGQLPEG